MRKMPREDRKNCRHCKRHVSEVGPISHSGACSECGLARMNQNILELHARSGPSLIRWRRAIAASVGAVLLDELPTEQR